jgi:hypothetical protein
MDNHSERVSPGEARPCGAARRAEGDLREAALEVGDLRVLLADSGPSGPASGKVVSSGRTHDLPCRDRSQRDAKHPGLQGGGGITWRHGESWGARFDVSAHSLTSGAAGLGTADARSLALVLCAEYHLRASDSGSLDILLGPSLERIAVSTHGFTQISSATLLDFGPAAAVEWEQRLVSGLSVSTGVRAGLRLHEDSLLVHGPDADWTVLEISPLRLSATLGLSWQLF